MKYVTVNTYQPTGDQDPGVTILIDGPIASPQGTFPESLINAEREFDLQAESLFRALRDNLPGGTIDHLTAKLLIYKASHFVVSHENLAKIEHKEAR